MHGGLGELSGVRVGRWAVLSFGEVGCEGREGKERGRETCRSCVEPISAQHPGGSAEKTVGWGGVFL